MKVQIACLSLASVLMLSASPVVAADWSGARSYKDVSSPAAVPVPAPVPIPDEIKDDWYVGISTGAVMIHDASIDSIGSPLPVHDAADLTNNMIFGISFGRYITPSLRAELSFEYQRPTTLAGPHESNYTDTRSDRGADFTVDNGTTSTTFATYDTNHYNVSRFDEVELSRTSGMVGLVYDFKTGSRFTPYVGAGVGVTVRKMHRTVHEVAECDYSTNTHRAYPNDSCIIVSERLPLIYEVNEESKVTRADLAVALKAGFGYELYDGITWDNGYQLMWEAASISIDAPTLNGISTVSFGDSLQHQFRTGLRFAVN